MAEWVISKSLIVQRLSDLYHTGPCNFHMQDPKGLSPQFTDKMRGQLANFFLMKAMFLYLCRTKSLQFFILMFVCFAYLGFGFNYICIPGEDIIGY